MDFKNTLRTSLMMYPSIHPNALTVYDHLFCVIGNGYSWENGELVEHGKKATSVKDAVIKAIEFHLIDPVVDPFDHIDIGLDYIKEILNYKYKHVIEEIEMIFDVDSRMKDFSFETPDKYFGYGKHLTVEDKYMLYDICEYSKICNLPDDIKPDWLEAAEKMYEILVANPERVKDDKNLLPKVKERIEELKKSAK